MNDSVDRYSQHTKCTCDKTASSSDSHRQQEIWKHLVNQLTRSMYQSTAIGVPPPEPHLDATNYCEYCRQYQRKPSTFNADILSTKDVSHYRQQRSESLLFRVYRKAPLELEKINVLRIDKGVFIAQQTRPPSQPSPSIEVPEYVLESFLSSTGSDLLLQDTAPVSNFDFGVLAQLVTNTNNLESSHQQYSPTSTVSATFIPYTYTVGARYTSMNGHRNDYIIRGVIPLWCQTLLLDRIYRSQPPIEADETRYGLIPFATDLPLSFQSLLGYRDKTHEMDHVDDELDDPDMLIWYERLAMDDAGRMVIDNASSDYGDAYWGANRLDVMRKLVYCHIPPDLSQMISDLGNEWINAI